ncbi:hypothetical protein FMN50_20330 [Rhodobacterales bacterium]|nr:hypothetical protein FMN50_20330 [Rhodobacterales bacterium]
MADDDRNETIAGAHTPRGLEPDAEKSAKVGDQTAFAQAALDDLAGQIQPEADPEPSDLFDDEPSLFSGPVAHVAETFAENKGRGRPRGSKNKANQQFRDTLLRMGYRHPGLNLADLANADPHKLAAELSRPYTAKSGPRKGELVEASCTPAEALELIRKANVELMPYFESKRPTEEIKRTENLHVLIIDNGGFAPSKGSNDGFMSITGTVAESDDKSDT